MSTAAKNTTQLKPGEAEEIDQIMSEIEELQQEMNQADASATKKLHAVASPENVLEEFHETTTEPALEETLVDLKEDGSAGPTLLDDELSSEAEEPMMTEDELDETVAMHEEKDMNHTTSHAGSNDGSLTMTLNGSMTLKLQYEVEGQLVSVSFIEQTLLVRLTDGTEFKIPLQRTGKKAA